MGGGGAEGHPLIAGYGSSSCLLFGEQGNGGNRPQLRGESSTPPTKSSTLTSMSAPISRHLRGGKCRIFCPGVAEFTGTRVKRRASGVRSSELLFH